MYVLHIHTGTSLYVPRGNS